MAKLRIYVDPSLATWQPGKNFREREATKLREIADAERILREREDRAKAKPKPKPKPPKTRTTTLRPQHTPKVSVTDFDQQLAQYFDECWRAKTMPSRVDLAVKLGYTKTYFYGGSNEGDLVKARRVKYKAALQEYLVRFADWAAEVAYARCIERNGKYSVGQLATDYCLHRSNLYKNQIWKPVKNAIELAVLKANRDILDAQIRELEQDVGCNHG
jgi:hypothetical protein